MSIIKGTAHRDRRVRLAAVILVLISGEARAVATDEPTLHAALLREAPRVLGYLKGHGYRNVGVLKFRVKKGTASASDHVGPLNLNLAGRLEVALILADDLKEPLGIIREADAVAATLPGANHLTKPGRQALFKGRYRLAWGNAQVAADAFLTGVVVVNPDRRTMNVGIMAFDRNTEALETVTRFTASTDAPTLAEAGESFLIRGIADDGRVETQRETAVAAASQSQTAPAVHPLRDPKAPVTLEVRYDGAPVPFEIREGEATVREPREGQKVAFVIRKVDRSKERYGVVLLVNDENTLFKERAPAVSARKWILTPEHRETAIHGYQTGAKQAEAFRVLSDSESKTNVVRYGPAGGLITLVVFREPSPAVRAAPPALDDDAEDLAALSRGVLPKEPPQTLAALKFQLREGSGPTRGLIQQGQTIDAAIADVAFRPDPTPILSTTIRYHTSGR